MTAVRWQMQQNESNPIPECVRAGRRAIAFGALILACVMLSACASSTSESIQPSGGSEVESPRTGGELFAANCAVCHGATGEGHPEWRTRNADGTLPPPPLNGDGHTWHHGDGLLYRIVSQGGQSLEIAGDSSFKSAMPAFGDQLSHEEIIEVLDYVKSLWTDKTVQGMSIRETQARISERDPFPSEAGDD